MFWSGLRVNFLVWFVEFESYHLIGFSYNNNTSFLMDNIRQQVKLKAKKSVNNSV